MTASYNTPAYEPFTPDEDEFVARNTDDLGDTRLNAWRIWFRHFDASDEVGANEGAYLGKLGVADPLTVKTRRRWLDALLVGRLLRAAPLPAEDTIKWEPFLCDISAALDHFIQTHLRVEGNTEVGEAVMACVSTVSRLELRLREYDLHASREAAVAARQIIFDDYVLFLGREFPTTAPVADLKAIARRIGGAP